METHVPMTKPDTNEKSLRKRLKVAMKELYGDEKQPEYAPVGVELIQAVRALETNLSTIRYFKSGGKSS